MKFIAYDAEGRITGFYGDGESLPPGDQNFLAVSDEQWDACLSAPSHLIKDGVLIPPTPPADPVRLAALQARLCGEINIQADAVYSELGVTSPGRLAEYQHTLAHAIAFQAAGFRGTAPPSVAVVAEAHRITPRLAAQRIITTAKAWDKRMMAVRSARILGKARVMVAASDEAAQTAGDLALAQLRAVLAWPHESPAP